MYSAYNLLLVAFSDAAVPLTVSDALIHARQCSCFAGTHASIAAAVVAAATRLSTIVCAFINLPDFCTSHTHGLYFLSLD